MLDEVSIASTSAFAAYSTTGLRTELCERSTLDISEVRDSHNTCIVSIEVFRIEVLATTWVDHCLTFVAVFLLHFNQFVLHHLLAKFRIVENLLEVFDEFQQIVILSMQFLLLQTGQLTESHIDNILSLSLIEAEAFHQSCLSLLRSLRRLDNLYHFVDIVAGDDKRF